jgi:tetratricopeptide (TPR) repeat protein
LDPQNYVSYINMGVVFNALGQNREAIEAYSKALEISPASKEALLNRAIGFTKVRDFSAAFRDYEHLIEIDRGTDYTGRAHFNMGFICYYYTKDYEQASYHFEEARRVDPVKYNTEKWLGKPIEVEKIETLPGRQHQR